MSDEYIRRDTALRAVTRRYGACRSPAQNRLLDEIRNEIRRAPAADVAEVVHAYWIEDGDTQICSNCGEEHEWDAYRASFCDTCGAIMEDTNE